MKQSARIASIGDECVACGTCVTVCPRSALRIEKGIRSVVDPERCVGCGKCAVNCPAAVISTVERMVTQ